MKHVTSLHGLPMSRADTWIAWERMLNAASKQSDVAVVQTERWLGTHDLFYLLVRLLRRSDIDHDWLFARCREVERNPNGYLDLWAREHYKSTIITFGLTISDILNDPETTVGIFSHTRGIAKTFLRQIKNEFEGNVYLKTLYADVLWMEPQREAPKWSEDDGIIVKRTQNPKEATVEAWGLVDGQPTSKHYSRRVYDDVVTRESVATPEQITKTTSAWELSDNLGTQNGVERYIGTRYALYDTYSEIIKRNAATVRLYPATHNGRMDGNPVFFSKELWAKKLKTQSRTSVAAQLLQNPMADSAATFRVEWLKSYYIRPRTLNVYIMCDPSRGRSATSDNTAMAVVGISSNGAKFLLDGVCHRMQLSDRWKHLRRLRHKWARTPGVQHIAVGYERYGAQSDDEYFKEKMLEDLRNNIHDAVFTIQELNWPRDGTESKRERVERLEPDFRQGRFFLPLPVLYESQPRFWRVDTDPDSVSYNDILYERPKGQTREQLLAIANGQQDQMARVIKSVDDDDRVYDVTRHFIDEFLNFPFGRYKDLIDATSRIYDMEPVVPVDASKLVLEPRQYFDR